MFDASAPPLLNVEGLSVSFPGSSGPARVVRDVSFQVRPGEVVGMVGESGSGKSVTALSTMRLLDESSATLGGNIWFEGTDLLTLSEKQMRKLRGREIAMAFQEPMTALDPVFTVGRQMADILRTHMGLSKKASWKRSVEMLERVGIPAPGERAHQYPHQLSGGMRQRVMVAMALICEPKLLIADEPTTAVDVTIQAQILELIRELSREMGSAVLFITHDLGVVTELCDSVVTLYAGEVVEYGATSDILRHPAHPYTSGLLQSTPRIETRTEPLVAIPGTLSMAHAEQPGCTFASRCSFAMSRCFEEPQSLVSLPSASTRLSRCWRTTELTLAGVSR